MIWIQNIYLAFALYHRVESDVFCAYTIDNALIALISRQLPSRKTCGF